MKKNLLLLLIKGMTCLLFLGRGWQHLRWDTPYRSLFWDQHWMEGAVNALLGMDWTTYATHPSVDKGIQMIATCFGILYLVCAGASLWIGAVKAKKITGVLMLFGSLGLLFLSFLYGKERFFQLGQFLEYAIQWSLPLIAWQIAYGKKTITFWMKALIAATFIGHGMYAVGIYPVPGDYIEMTLNIFGGTESGAKNFLFVMGILDFVAVVGLFWKGKERYFLVYMIIWGFLTALARVVGHFHWDMALESMSLWLHETLVRLGHGGLPLVLYIILRNEKK